jgi:hypothetical protein
LFIEFNHILKTVKSYENFEEVLQIFEELKEKPDDSGCSRACSTMGYGIYPVPVAEKMQ